MPYGNCNKSTYHGELARGNEVANGEAEGHVSLKATIWAPDLTILGALQRTTTTDKGESKDSHCQVLTAELMTAR
jgi:hypothetical protein